MTSSAPAAEPRPAVRTEREGAVAVILIDNPPVNAGSLAVREGLLAALTAVASDPSVAAVVIMGDGRSFISGSDLKEFDLPLAEPQLPAVIRAVEDCPKTVVAALHGAALGGGFELALGCDARIATAATVVALPEATLGMIPGAGGTQRLPRMVGTTLAIDLVCSGRRVEAEEALRYGMIDQVAKGNLRAAATALALTLTGRKSLVIERAVPDDGADEEVAAAAALKAGRNRPHIAAAIRHVRAARSVPAARALADERADFQRLRVSPEAKAIRHLFFAEREAARGGGLNKVPPRPLARFGVVGAGTMGAGIALAALQTDLSVVLVERDPAALQRGLTTIKAQIARRVETGRLTEADVNAMSARLTAGLDLGTLADCDLIAEAVVEDLAVKTAVFRTLDGLAKPGAVLASNTSYLNLDAIAAATGRPQDVIGLHFFSPAHVMRLLEVVRGKDSAEDALATGLALANRLGKQPVVAGNRFGFIGNRLYAAYRRHCEFMLEEGALPQDVDKALEAFGFAMGPFAVADLSGLDIAWRMRLQQASTRDPAARYVTIPDRLCEMGRLGRKTGAGYYRYKDGPARGAPDPEVEAIILAASADAGRTRHSFTAEEIVRRALLALANEAAVALADGAAMNADDIDVVLVNGYGFPRWAGGPVHWARNEDPGRLISDCDSLVTLAGPGTRRGDLSLLLRPPSARGPVRARG